VADHAHSDDPAVQAQLDRFAQLSPGRDILGLERIERLLALLDNPHLDLPPVYHVAGTNGKGSTCAFLRTALEAGGRRVHAYTSPHLVRFNERIRVAGNLITDEALAPLLAEVLDAAEADGMAPSFFEATTAAAFLAFSRTKADVAIIEVGLGGRLDATNIIPKPLICGIAQLGIDHEAFLLDPENGPDFAPLERIGFEKAGIAKANAPLVTMAYPETVAVRIADVAASIGTTTLVQGRDWHCQIKGDALIYRDAKGPLRLPLPHMAGDHQIANAGLAIAMLRHQERIALRDHAFTVAMEKTQWPARMQRLTSGPFVDLVKPAQLWLDGGHNPNAAEAIAATFLRGPALDVIIGMLANKDAAEFLRIIAPVTRSVTAVPTPGHDCHAPDDLAAMAQSAGIGTTATAPDVESALRRLGAQGDLRRVAILGSLYLAGVVLKENGPLPD
jgi:dihydrofolate synthase/folylpolyglutamate synthase